MLELFYVVVKYSNKYIDRLLFYFLNCINISKVKFLSYPYISKYSLLPPWDLTPIFKHYYIITTFHPIKISKLFLN
jgi:hypothetical protein